MTFSKTVCACAMVLVTGILAGAADSPDPAKPSVSPADTKAAPAAASAPAATNATPAAAAAPADADADSADTNAVPAEAEAPVDPKFERYKTIMDRMPFGPEPVNFNPDAPGSGSGASGGAGGAGDAMSEEAMQSAEEQKIIASVRVSALNVTPSGKIAVGFTDSSKQPAGNYYLKVGETRDGWTVKAADATEMTVTLEQGGVEATLKLGEGSVPDAKGGAKKGGPGGGLAARMGQMGRAGLLRPPGGGGAAAPAGTDAAGGSAFANLRARRAQREAERQAEAARQSAAAEQAKADRERAAAEREQQREALLQIQEELRRQREAKQAAGENASAENGGEAANGAEAGAAQE